VRFWVYRDTCFASGITGEDAVASPLGAAGTQQPHQNILTTTKVSLIKFAK